MNGRHKKSLKTQEAKYHRVWMRRYADQGGGVDLATDDFANLMLGGGIWEAKLLGVKIPRSLRRFV